MKNYAMANKGQAFETEIEYANQNYKARGIANIQKISTPWKVIRQGNKIVSAFPEGKSTLDFRGTIKGGISISFDCKESRDERGLPLKYIKEHQIEYMRLALELGEISFILCSLVLINKRCLIPGDKVIKYYDHWRANPRKRGINFIPVRAMVELNNQNGIVLDYLDGLY